MKTIKEIKEEIASIEQTFAVFKKNEIPPTEAQRKRAGREVSLLRNCVTYLESNPREDFLKEQEGQIKKRILLIEQGFADWREANKSDDDRGEADDYKFVKAKARYYLEMRVSDLKLQSKTLNYLLS